MAEPGKRHQRSRKAGARMPDGAIYVGRGRGQAGRWGNPFLVGGQAVVLLAAVFELDTWKARQWAAARLYAHWIAGSLDQLPAAIATAARDELAGAGNPTPPTLEEIRRELAFTFDRGRDVVCWCQLFVDCHGDILRAVAIGRDPVNAAGTSPRWADNFRCIEENREAKRVEIRANIKRRSYVKGWTAW